MRVFVAPGNDGFVHCLGTTASSNRLASMIACGWVVKDGLVAPRPQGDRRKPPKRDFNHMEARNYVPTSVQLSKMLGQAQDSEVSIGWLVEQLGRRSFGLTFLVMAVVALLPGASTIVGLLVAWPAIQIILGHDVAVLPRLIARRKISVDRLARLISIVTPRLAWMESLIRPRWPRPFDMAKRLTGIVVLLLGLTMILPVPFGNVLPALTITLLALAYLEEDGIAFLVAMLAALASLAIAVATVWGTVETIDWIDPARPR